MYTILELGCILSRESEVGSRLRQALVALALGLVLAACGEEIEPEAQPVTTVTTVVPTTSTTVIGGISFPVPPLPPGVGVGETAVENIHRRVTTEEICANPELLRALNESALMQQIGPMQCPTTTTRP